MSDLVQEMRQQARGLLDFPFWIACADELARAIADRDRLAREHAFQKDALDAMTAARDRLAAELSAARADAERLDYVEKSGREVMNWTFKGVLHWGVDRIGFDDIKWEPTLRAAIDAARTAPSAGGRDG